LSYCELNKEI